MSIQYMSHFCLNIVVASFHSNASSYPSVSYYGRFIEISIMPLHARCYLCHLYNPISGILSLWQFW